MKRYVIIGDGAAGTTAAQYLRAADREATIAILSDDPHAAYFRAALTNYLLGALRSEQIFAVPPSFYEELRIHRALARVSQVDTRASQVCLAQGGRVPYDALLLASGARARPPIFDGWWLPGIMTMRTLQDVNRVMDLVQQRSLRAAVLVGGGPLALEWAHGLSHRGVRVTMVIREQRFLPTAIDGVSSDLLLARLRRGGVDVRMGDEVAAAIPGQDRRVGGVALRSGGQVPCELLAVAIGVICNSEFLAKSGITVAANGGVVVDAQMRTNIPNVYAAGDVATFEGKLLQLWEPARMQGRIAAASMTGRNAQYAPGAHYMATRLYDLDCASIGEVTPTTLQGLGPSEELVDFPQGTGKISYRKLAIRDGRLVGALMFGEREAHVRRIGRAFKRLIDAKLDVRSIKDDLMDPAFDLPGWLNRNALVDKPRQEEAAGVVALGSVQRIRGARSMMLEALPPLPQGPTSIGDPSTDAYGATIDGDVLSALFAEAGPPPVVAVHAPQGRIVISGTSAIIGRDPQCAIPLLQDRMVSAAHAEITISSNAAWVRDLGSANGTWVSGESVTTPRRLKSGDKIRVGLTELGIHIEGGAAAAGTAGVAPAFGISAAPWAGELSPHLEVRSGHGLGLSFELVQSPTTIGRDPACTIRLDDEWIDLVHAYLRQGRHGWEVADAETHGVTKKNGGVLSPNAWVPIAPGDVIEVGYVEIAYVMRQPSLPGQFGAVAGSARISGVPPAMAAMGASIGGRAQAPAPAPMPGTQPLGASGIGLPASAPSAQPVPPYSHPHPSAPQPQPMPDRGGQQRHAVAIPMRAVEAPPPQTTPASAPVTVPDAGGGPAPNARGRGQVARAMPVFAPAPGPAPTPASLGTSAMSATPRARGRVSIRSGPGLGAFAELLEGVTVVGNLAGQCTLVIPDPQLAARHLEIARMPDGFYARSLGLSGGTFCRGQHLGPQPFRLTHGDILRLGANVEIVFEVLS